MEITAKCIAVLPEQRFDGKKGIVVKNLFVVETNEQYAKKICLVCLGEERWAQMGILVGHTYSLSIDVSSREWQGKWFTEAQCWKAVCLDNASSNATGGAIADRMQEASQAAAVEENNAGGGDDVPF